MDVLAEEREVLMRETVAQLLVELSERWGVTWSDTARLVGISVPALRKWRRAENDASPENQHRLATLVAFLRQLQRVGVRSPASWVNLPLVEGYAVRVSDLQPLDCLDVVIDHAASNINSEQLLDALDDDWRERWATDLESVIAEDGQQSLVRVRGRTNSEESADS